MTPKQLSLEAPGADQEWGLNALEYLGIRDDRVRQASGASAGGVGRSTSSIGSPQQAKSIASEKRILPN
ncbi:MAG TPA: hypothetical protein VKX28_32155 [Xanthobacteraceae bacterium]|nr:hypothetical protein [Xanthobacteraceae bacterium]